MVKRTQSLDSHIEQVLTQAVLDAVAAVRASILDDVGRAFDAI